MSTLDVVQRLRAVQSGRAQARTSLRHRHLESKPLVVVVYRLAGESAAPLGVMYGTSERGATLLVAPEPRSRQIRFEEVFNPFARAVNAFVQGRSEHRVVEGNRSLCRAAPQIIVPNAATAEFVGPLMGRSLRYLRTDGPFAVPNDTVLAGAHLTWIGQQGELPGSSVLLPATDLLRRHWVCGLSDLESEDLHVQLAWIDPPARSTGAKAAATIERQRFDGRLPAAGPTPDPSWDREVLDPLISTFNERRAGKEDHATVARLGQEIRAAVHDALEPAWTATWRTITLLRGLPEASSVAKRWRNDRWAFTRHSDRVVTGNARFRTRDSVKQAAFIVSQREDAQAQLDADEALDDPLVMAAAIGDGHAIAGKVTRVDRPFVELELSGPCLVPPGTELYWSEMRGKCSVLVGTPSGTTPTVVRLETKKGKTKYYPEVGERAVYCPFTAGSIPAPKMPEGVPWTHQGAESARVAPEVPE